MDKTSDTEATEREKEKGQGKGKGTPGRKGLTAEQVFSAADAIWANGSAPTNLDIVKMLGGSCSTISPLLRQWRAAKITAPVGAPISDAMLKALEGHAKAACSESDKRWRAQLEATTADAESLEQESDRLISERDALLQEVALIRTELDGLSGRFAQQEAEIERSRRAEAVAREAETVARISLAKLELERDRLVQEMLETEHGVDEFRREHSQTLVELNAAKVELAKYQGRLEIITDRMFDPKSH
jgi:hypothetical protein